MLRSILLPLYHYLRIFFILILTRFYNLYFYIPVLLKCFTTCGLKSLIWNTKLWSALEELNLIKAVHKFSFIIKHTGTFRCVCVCTALYGAYNCQGFLRQASKLILSVTVRGAIIVSRICDYWSHGKETRLNPRPTMRKRMIVTTGLSEHRKRLLLTLFISWLSDDICFKWKITGSFWTLVWISRNRAGFRFLFFEDRTDSDFENQESDHLWLARGRI